MPIEDQQAVSPSSPRSGSSLPPLLRVALKRKRLVGYTALIVLALSMLVALLMPARYTAEAVILAPQNGQSAGASMMAQLTGLGGLAGVGANALGLKNPNDQQVAFLQSRTVEDAVIQRFGLQSLYRCKYLSAARKVWAARTSAESGVKDGLIRLKVTDHNAQRAAAMANAWVDQYQQLLASMAVSDASRRRLFFERQLNGARDDLARAEEQMKQTELRTGVIELDGQASAMIGTAAMLRAQVAAKQVEIEGMRQFAADGNPDLERAEQELSALEAQLAVTDVGTDRRSGDLVVPKGSTSEAGLEYARALREVQYREAVVKLLAQQYEMARVDEAQRGEAAQVVDAAVVPDRPDRLLQLVVAAAGLLLCLPLALLLALTAELLEALRALRRRAASWTEALELAWSGEAR